MKTFSTMILAGVMAIAACGGGGKKADTTPPDTSTSNTGSGSDTGTTTTGEGMPCSQEVAMVCPDDQIDGCLKQPAEGDTHKCVAK